MVVHMGIGIGCQTFTITAFDTITKVYNNFDISMKKEDFKDAKKSNIFFLSIKEKIGDNIGYCCFDDWGVDYLKIRPHILADGEKHGFLKIEFLDYGCAKYIYALYSNNIIPKFNDAIWVEQSQSNSENLVNYGIFQKSHKKAIRLKTVIVNISDKKLLVAMRPPSFVLNWKSDKPRDMSLINKMFPYCKVYTFDPCESHEGFLLKAKIMARNQQLMPLDVKSGLLYTINFTVNNFKVFTIPENFSFPFTKSISISNIILKEKQLSLPNFIKPNLANKMDKSVKGFAKIAEQMITSQPKPVKHELKINFTSNPMPEVIPFYEKFVQDKAIIKFSVDINGIFSVEILPQNDEIHSYLKPIMTSPNHLSVHDVTRYIQNSIQQQNFFITHESVESQIILLFDAKVNVENYITTLFGRQKVIRIDLKEVENLKDLNEINGRKKGNLWNFINEPLKFSDVAYIFENIDQCQNESVKSFMINLLKTRKIQYEFFYSPLIESLIAVTVSDPSITNLIEKTSSLISESPYKASSIYTACLTQRDTLSLEAYQRFFAVTRNTNNFKFDIQNLSEQVKSEMIQELNEIFQKAFIKKSFILSDFTTVVESEIEDMLPSYPNTHKWLSTSSHPTKKVLCYAGDAIHFTLLDCEQIQLKFPETSEKLILVKNKETFDQILPFHYLPALTLHVNESFISMKLFQEISTKIESVYIDQFDQRTFGELSSTIAQELTEAQQKPWGCFVSNSTSLMEYNFPAEFVHYLLPSQGTYFSLVVYRQIISLPIQTFVLKPKAKIIGTFLNDTLNIYGNRLLMFLTVKNQNGLKICLNQLFQENEFTMLTGFSIEGFEYYRENFSFRNYIYISCNDITLLAFV